MSSKFFLNNGKEISEHGYPYFIAELNSSHFGDIDSAKKMIDSAKESGVDCVKFQSWTPSSLYSKTYYRENPIAERFVKKFSMSESELYELFKYCKEIQIDFASTPYSETEVEFLIEKCSVPFIKIASMEVNNLEFLKYVGSKKTAVILSTGMSTYEEIIKAVETLKSAGNESLLVFHCVSVYPVSSELINLNNIFELRRILPGIPIGFSDHSIGNEAAIGAVSIGCPIIEKHFTFDNTKIGLDNQMATMPTEFKEMIQSCYKVYSSMGSIERLLSEEEINQRSMMRRSIVSSKPIKKGAIINSIDLTFKRPGNGIPPSEINAVIGKHATKDIEADETIMTSDFV